MKIIKGTKSIHLLLFVYYDVLFHSMYIIWKY